MNYNPKCKEYLEAMLNISKTTVDYFYVWDILNARMWFFGGDLEERFHLKANSFESIHQEAYFSIVHPSDYEELTEHLTAIKEGKVEEYNFNYRLFAKEEKPVWVNNRGSVVEKSDGLPSILVGSVSFDVLENKINEITGLYNRRVLLSDVRSHQALNKYGSFMFLSLDKMAKVYSEHNGEYVTSLIELCGKVLEWYISDRVNVYHVEDDVFVVYSLYDEEETEESAEAKEQEEESRILALFEEISDKLKTKLTMTAVAYLGNKAIANAKEMYIATLKELSKAKYYNRSKLTFISKEDIKEKFEEIALSEELTQSVANDFEGFYAVYQPQFKNGSFELIGAEALMRYKSAITGIEHSPVEFIPLLSQAGLMKDAGIWILKKSLQQVKKWREFIPNLCLNVNFSLKSLKAVASEIIKAYKESGLPAKSLFIEITETVGVEEVDNVSILIRALKRVGIGISIDDFGKGYSNLALLKQIKCDEIKIEKDFVTGIEKGSYGYLLINSVIGFSRNNGIQVCCEGVETENDVLTLVDLQPDLYQGFVFDKPCTVEQFENRYVKTDSEEYQARKDFSNALKKKAEEQITKFDPKDILANIGVGLTVFYCDYENDEYEMHPDFVTEKILGIEEKLSPLECNEFWYSRIKKGYVSFVKKSLDEMLKTDKVVQFVYPWKHPKLGEIIINFSGLRSRVEGNKIAVQALFRVLSSVESLGGKKAKKSIAQSIKNKYLDSMLGNAIAAMEINLSQNRADFGVRNLEDIMPDISSYPHFVREKNGSVLYDEFEKWWAETYIVDNKEEYLAKSNCQYLINEYAKGETSVELSCRCLDKVGNVYDAWEEFYITKDELSGDIMALCVLYDNSVQAQEALLQKNRDNVIRSICDEFRSIIHVNLDNDTFEFFREDIFIPSWRSDVHGYEQMISLFADLFVVEKDMINYKFMLSRSEIRRRLQNQDVFKFEYDRICDDGKIHRHEVKVKKDWSNENGDYVIIGVKDVEKSVRLMRELGEALDMAYTDYLTGLYNQQGLKIKCSELLADKSTSRILMFMDLDNFKKINDEYGHSMGDKVLYEVGKILKEETRGKDIVGRYGGDEFIALLSEPEDAIKSSGVVERIKDRIENVCFDIGLNIGVTASIGLAHTLKSGFDYRLLKEIADDSLYDAKKAGKNKIAKNF